MRTTVQATVDHPVFVPGKGWVPAGELVVGSTVGTGDGGTAVVVGRQDSTVDTRVYNLSIAQDPTFLVTAVDQSVNGTRGPPAQALAVHNCPTTGGGERFGPMNPGPLEADDANTFRSSSYTKIELEEPLTLYRVYGNKADRKARYWSRTEPGGRMQVMMDSAIVPEWKNSMEHVAVIRAPAGTIIYDGAAAPQFSKKAGPLPGGGSQVLIEQHISEDWFINGT